AFGHPLAQERVEAGDGRVRVEPGQRPPIGDDDRPIGNDVAAGGAGLDRGRREGRAAEHGVAGQGLGELAQRRERGGDEIEGGPGPFRRARVARETGDLHEQLGPAPMPDAQVAARRLAEDDGRGPDLAAGDEVLHPPPAALLQHRVRDDHVAGRALVHEVGGRVGLNRERPLDVHGAAAVQEAVGDVAAERRVLPLGGVADVDHVEVRAEHDGRRGPAASHAADHVPDLVDPDVVEAERFELGADAVRDVALPAGRAGDADQVAGERDDALEAQVEGHADAGAGVPVCAGAKDGEARSPGLPAASIDSAQPSSAVRSWRAPSISACIGAAASSAWMRANHGASTRATMLISLIRMFMDGPAVSLNGSPTVSPTTPPSMYFLALPQAPPELAMKGAISTPVTVAPASRPPSACTLM